MHNYYLKTLCYVHGTQYAYISASTTLPEQTMNLVTKLLNALAFSNVNNLGDLRALLRQIDSPSSSEQDQFLHGSVSALGDQPSVAPEFRRAQGAL
mgnify:CR=1 FL=1